MAGIGFLIAMFGVASCLLGGLYFLFRDDHPSDEARSAVSGSWYRTGNSFYSSSEPSTLPVFGLTRCAWAHARHVTWT